MDIVVQQETSLAFPYSCIIAVCPAAIPTWKRSFNRHARLIIPQEFIWDVEKCSLILASYFSYWQTEWEGDFSGCYSCAVKSDMCENAPAQQRTRPRTCLRDMVWPSPHLCSTFVLDVLSSADCPPHFRRGLKFCIGFLSPRSKTQCWLFVLVWWANSRTPMLLAFGGGLISA